MTAFIGDSSKCGVYIIENLMTQTVYIGSTAQTFFRRWASHQSLLRLKKHGNIHLQRAYDLNGASAFRCSVLEYVEDADQILAREQYWLDHYRQRDIYNMCPIAESPAGRKVSAAQKAKLSQILKAIKSQPEDRKRQSDLMRGRKLNTKEHYQKLSQQNAKTYPGLIGPDGTEYRDITNMAAFCREHGLSAKKMHSVAKGTKLSHLGWTAIGVDRDRMLTRVFNFCDPSGAVYENITNLTEFCKAHGLLTSAMSQVFSGQINNHKGWRRVDGSYRKSFAFVSPDVVRYDDIRNLKLFCLEHGLNKDAMSLLHTGKRMRHKGWTKGVEHTTRV